MRLAQFHLPDKGRRVGLILGDRVQDITLPEEGVLSTLDLLQQGRTPAGLIARVTWLARGLRRKPLDWPALQRGPSRAAPHLLLPLEPPEVWGVEGTYGTRPDAPSEFFFKGTAPRCLGPFAAVPTDDLIAGLAPEAELAVVLGAGGAIFGLTAANDLTARGPLPAEGGTPATAKITRGGTVLGPCLVTPDELAPDALQLRSAIWREGRELYAGTTNSRELQPGIPELVRRFLALGRLLPGTVLLTGTGIEVPEALRLREGDRTDVEIEGIGGLRSPVGGRGRPSLPRYQRPR
jgi:2-dehydro-3-deoxy-D-arabinonate dehydratase